MGLGKTLQTISLICHIKEKHGATGPSLIICPLSVLYSWCNEVKKWAPSLKHLRFHNSNTESVDQAGFGEYDLVVTTYEMIKAPAFRRLWSRQHFNLLVLDEGKDGCFCFVFCVFVLLLILYTDRMVLPLIVSYS